MEWCGWKHGSIDSEKVSFESTCYIAMESKVSIHPEESGWLAVIPQAKFHTERGATPTIWSSF
jgi:hypothetical protein